MENYGFATRALDDALILAERSTLSAVGAEFGQKDGAAQVIDLGENVTEHKGVLVADVFDVTSDGTQKYSLILQGSKTPDFSLLTLELVHADFGAASEIIGNDVDTFPGRYFFPFRNINLPETPVPSTDPLTYAPFRYLRTVMAAAGAGTINIEYQARLIRE